MNNKKIVLITEDEAALRSALYDKLLAEGFSVFEAKNGEEGLEIALREHPDLILIDILMPKMDGLTMLKKLRENSWGKKAHFIILTNVNDVKELAKAIVIAQVKDNESFEYFVKSDTKIESVVDAIKRKLML